jgi:hypothetical protein
LFIAPAIVAGVSFVIFCAENPLMRFLCIALASAVALSGSLVIAHGPQIQITRDGDQITTRRLFREESYVRNLSSETRVYVIPLMETTGEWYARPNNHPSATLPGQPEYLSGPGIAYGFDQLDGGPRDFASGERFELNLIAGLLLWNGATFSDPGLEEIQAFRTSGASVVTNDSLIIGEPATLAYSNVSATYNTGAHSGALFRLLDNDGVASESSDDGVYLLSMTYGSSQPGLADSSPFYFLLHKNVPFATVQAAASSLGFAPRLVQFVPEPGGLVLAITSAAIAAFGRQSRRKLRK